MSAPNVTDVASGVPQQNFDGELPGYSFGLVLAALGGTASVLNGSTSVTFSSNQTLNQGAAVYFASQPGIAYYLAAAVVASTAATLTVAYSGTSAAATTTNAVNAVSGTVTVTNGSRNITFSGVQTFALGTIFQFSAQPGVYYTLSAAIAAATAAVLTTAYQGVTSSTGTTIAAAALTGTVTVTNASAAITFSVAQTLAEGTALMFSAQPGVVYSLAAAIAAATAATIAQNFSGATSSTGGTVAGVNDYMPARVSQAYPILGGVSRGLLCTSAGTAVIDAMGINGPGSGATWLTVVLTSGQQLQLAFTKMHHTSSGAFISLY